MELMSHRPPRSCIRDAANAFPKIQKEKALTKVKAECLDNHGKSFFLESLNFSQHILFFERI